jgi:hypothetical protein
MSTVASRQSLVGSDLPMIENASFYRNVTNIDSALPTKGLSMNKGYILLLAPRPAGEA